MMSRGLSLVTEAVGLFDTVSSEESRTKYCQLEASSGLRTDTSSCIIYRLPAQRFGSMNPSWLEKGLLYEKCPSQSSASI
jgi:hypothetical protein